jgi:hypothetical protein
VPAEVLVRSVCFILTRALFLLLLAAPPLAAAVRETVCSPEEVLVTEKRIEVICRESATLADRGRESETAIANFAYPLISQSYQPQFGSQVYLVDYFLDQLRTALLHDRKVRLWFETDVGTNPLWGCEPARCRALVAVALTDLGRNVPIE